MQDPRSSISCPCLARAGLNGLALHQGCAACVRSIKHPPGQEHQASSGCPPPTLSYSSHSGCTEETRCRCTVPSPSYLRSKRTRVTQGSKRVVERRLHPTHTAGTEHLRDGEVAARCKMTSTVRSPAILAGLVLLLARVAFAMSLGALEAMTTLRHPHPSCPLFTFPPPFLLESRPLAALRSSQCPVLCELSPVSVGRGGLRGGGAQMRTALTMSLARQLPPARDAPACGYLSLCGDLQTSSLRQADLKAHLCRIDDERLHPLIVSIVPHVLDSSQSGSPRVSHDGRRRRRHLQVGLRLRLGTPQPVLAKADQPSLKNGLS